MARTRGPSCAEPARRSSRLATRTIQAPRPLISQPPSKPARGRGPTENSRGGRLAHAVRQQKGCGVSGQPSLSPSFSVATDSHPHLPPRLLPAPCQSHAIRPHHRCHMQAMTYSPPNNCLHVTPVVRLTTYGMDWQLHPDNFREGDEEEHRGEVAVRIKDVDSDCFLPPRS